MTPVQVIQIIVGILTGGLMVYFLNIYRGRVQTIQCRMAITTVDVLDRRVGYFVVEGKDEREYQARRLSHVVVTLKNTSNKDFETFDFGIALPEGNTATTIKLAPPDRHHRLEILLDTALENLETPKTLKDGGEALADHILNGPPEIRQKLDFKAKPFTRGDKYMLDLIVVPLVINDGRFIEETEETLLEDGGVNPWDQTTRQVNWSGRLMRTPRTRPEAGSRGWSAGASSYRHPR